MASHELSGLIRYLGQDDWKACFDEILAAHLGPVLEAGNLTFGDLEEILGADLAMTLWGCAFEDFLTQEWEDGRNFVEVYLKRRGWKEGPRSSAYMRGLRSSVMSLYEVSGIVPGKSLMARDLLRGGDPVLVHEGTATRTLRPWDRIAARIVSSDGKLILGGGLLAYSPEACQDLSTALCKALRKRRTKTAFPKVETGMLRDLAPLFSLTWLFRTLEDMMGQKEGPSLSNSDGDELLFHEIRYPLAKGITQKAVAAVLDALPELRAESGSFWNWLRANGGTKKPLHPKAGTAKGLSLTSEMEDGSTVLGTLELSGRHLRFEINSRQRAERGQAMLAAALGGLVGRPLTQIMTPEQMTAARKTQPAREEAAEQPSIPPEEEARIIGEMMDRHYRQTLDEVIPALGNVTPRQAARTAAGRRKLVEWLKYLENGTAKMASGQRAMAAYDFGWLWEELGVSGLRQ